MKKEKSIHDKAIRLIEGGAVEVDGLSVKLAACNNLMGACFSCRMDSLCHLGTEISSVCMECDNITGRDNYLVFSKAGAQGE